MISPQLNRLIYAARMMSWLVDPRRLTRTPEYSIDRPIFLLGTQGGGLTILSRMLRRHPDVISAGGNCRYWTSADELQNVYGPILPAELTGLRYKAPPHPQWKSPRSWTYAVGDLFEEYRCRANQATPQLAGALKHAIRFSARRHAASPRRFRFVDKSQVYTVRVGLIHQLLHESAPRFVLVPRDPYVSVYRAATGKAADMKRLIGKVSLERRIDLCAEHYGNSMRAVFEDRDELDLDLHLVRFEDLLADAEARLRDVCDFCELAFRDDMLPARQHRMPLGSRFFDRWYPLRPNVNQVYDDRIDDRTIGVVNDFCGDIIERLGYAKRMPRDAARAA